MKGERGKKPTIEWYYRDWLSDRRLQMASPSSRGIWMNLLMFMVDCSLDGDDCTPGVLQVSREQLARLGGCTRDEADAFIEDGLLHKFCDVTVDGHDYVTITSRRLTRDEEKRKEWRMRKARQRRREKGKDDGSRDGHGNVTTDSRPISTSTSISNKKPPPPITDLGGSLAWFTGSKEEFDEAFALFEKHKGSKKQNLAQYANQQRKAFVAKHGQSNAVAIEAAISDIIIRFKDTPSVTSAPGLLHAMINNVASGVTSSFQNINASRAESQHLADKEAAMSPELSKVVARIGAEDADKPKLMQQHFAKVCELFDSDDDNPTKMRMFDTYCKNYQLNQIQKKMLLQHYKSVMKETKEA